MKSVQATESEWAELRGKFLLNGSPSKVFIYLEGPPVGTDILLKSFVVKLAKETLPSPPPPIEVSLICLIDAFPLNKHDFDY